MIEFKQGSLAERLILKPITLKDKKKDSMIDLSALDKRKEAVNTNQGIVYMIGPMAWYDLPEKPDIKIGDTVFYAKYGAMIIKVDGQDDEFVLCNDKDILVGYTNAQEVEAVNE